MKKLLLSVLLTISFCVVSLLGGGIAQAASKTLMVGTALDSAPFEFKDNYSNEYQGFDMDLIRALANQMGYDISIVDMEFDNLVFGVQEKEIDLAIAGIIIDADRAEKVNFSDPYFETGLQIVLPSKDYWTKGIKDLEGKKIAVLRGSFGEEQAKKIKNSKVKVFNDIDDCFVALKNVNVDAVIHDHFINDYFIATHPDFKLQTLPNLITNDKYGIIVSKDNPNLLANINRALKALRDSGEYDRIYNKWFGSNK